MKAVLLKNKIVSVENIKEAEAVTKGTGAKSNPYKYTVRISYFGGEVNFVEVESSDEQTEVLTTLVTAMNAK